MTKSAEPMEKTGRAVDNRSGKYLTFTDAPSFGFRPDTDYILGMAKVEGGGKILLDIDRVLRADEIDPIERAA